jgi:sugar O-acyltransferase (sialic acid O-acetyltransferase NeuD family)
VKKNVIIIGAGGFAAECHLYLHEVIRQDSALAFGGFLAESQNLDQYGLSEYFHGHYDDYAFAPNDRVVIGIGSPDSRQCLFELFVSRGVEFFTLIASTAMISSSVKLGCGNIFCHNVFVGPGVVLGDCNLFNVAATIGHDVQIGSFNILSPHCDITGYAKIGDRNFFGTHASMLPRSRVGSGNKIGAGSVVYKRIKNNVLAVGSPAMKVYDI